MSYDFVNGSKTLTGSPSAYEVDPSSHLLPIPVNVEDEQPAAALLGMVCQGYGTPKILPDPFVKLFFTAKTIHFDVTASGGGASITMDDSIQAGRFKYNSASSGFGGPILESGNPISTFSDLWSLKIRPYAADDPTGPLPTPFGRYFARGGVKMYVIEDGGDERFEFSLIFDGQPGHQWASLPVTYYRDTNNWCCPKTEVAFTGKVNEEVFNSTGSALEEFIDADLDKTSVTVFGCPFWFPALDGISVAGSVTATDYLPAA